MKIGFTKEWCLAKAREEVGGDISAGRLLFEEGQEAPEHVDSNQANLRMVLSRVVNLTRRQKGMGLEEFSRAADIDLEEAITIENVGSRSPSPRTLYQVSKTLDLPLKGLMQLAGLSSHREGGSLSSEALRFAANSEPIRDLSSKETAALEDFVAILAQQTAVDSRE